MEKLIDLQIEIRALLSKKNYLQLHQLALKLKVPEKYIIDTISEVSDIYICGKYFSEANNSIESYYTLKPDADFESEVSKIERTKQVVLLNAKIVKEIKTTNVRVAQINLENAKKTMPKLISCLFLLIQFDVIYAYEMALGLRELAPNETIRVNYLRTLDHIANGKVGK